MEANGERDQWFDSLCSQVLRLAGSPAEVVADYLPLHDRPTLGSATLVAWICRQAQQTATTADLVHHLMTSDLVPCRDRNSMVAVVRRIRLKWVATGLPIADWWDPDQLFSSLLEQLAPRMAADLGREVAERHLADLFRIGTGDIDWLLERTPRLPPLPRIPNGIIVTPSNDGGAEFLNDLATRPEVSAEIDRVVATTLLGGAGIRRLDGWRPTFEATEAWLKEGQSTYYFWFVLRQILELLPEALLGDVGSADVTSGTISEAAAIVEEAWRQCEAWRSALTTYEVSLIRQQNPRELRRRRWLDGHMHIHHAPLLVPDSVPDRTTSGEEMRVPAWTSSLIFERGGRFFHVSAGTMCQWFGTVTTDQEQRNLEAAMAEAVGIVEIDEGDVVSLNLAVEPGDLHQAALAPFRFSPQYVSEAVEIILLSLTGARLDWYRLRDDRDLEHLSVTRMDFPPRALDRLVARADATLERAEHNEPDKTPNEQLALAHLPVDQNELMFVGVDNAKSESILLDLELVSASASDVTIAAAEARAELAAAQLARVNADADGTPNAALRTAVEQARHRFHERRQRAGRTTGREFRDLVQGVVTDGRAFVQFAEAEDYLSALVITGNAGEATVEFVDLSHVTVHQARQISGIWLRRDQRLGGTNAAAILDEVLSWAGRDLMTPVVERLTAAGPQHVVLCPSQTLESIPLHAAPVTGGVLGDLFDISYAPSASVLSHMSTRRKQPAAMDLIVAASGADLPRNVGLASIAGPEQEASTLHELMPHARVLTGSRARPDEVLAAIATSGRAHLAAHGRAHPDMLASGLWLAGDTPAEALLSAARVHAGPPMSGTSLVVLSACATARHPLEDRAVQAWRGLDSAFLAQGAGAVIASLWEIADIAALVYSTVLHIALDEGTTIARAHTRATKSLRGEALHPRAAALLDTARPFWRAELQVQRIDSAYWWSAYRPSGVCW